TPGEQVVALALLAVTEPPGVRVALELQGIEAAFPLPPLDAGLGLDNARRRFAKTRRDVIGEHVRRLDHMVVDRNELGVSSEHVRSLRSKWHGGAMTPLVLVHGGSFSASCWELVVEQLDGPVLAVDLPGRGRHPAPLDTVTIETAAASVAADVDAAGFDDIVLVGHSLAGCSMPATIGLLGDRVRHAVFIACTVPEDGTSALHTLDPEVQA